MPASNVPLITPTHVTDIPGDLVQTMRGAWVTRLDDGVMGFIEPASGEIHRVTFVDSNFGPPEAKVIFFPDREHALIRSRNKLALRHFRGGERASIESPSKFDHIFVTQGGRYLWGLGYDDADLPLLYLFDGYTLQLLDTHAPQTVLYGNDCYDGTVQRLKRWEDAYSEVTRFMGRAVGEPLGLFASSSRLEYLMIVEVDPHRRIRLRSSPELETEVSYCSDEYVGYVGWGADGILLVLDDIDQVSLVDVEKKAPFGSSAWPRHSFESDTDPDAIRFPGGFDEYDNAGFDVTDAAIGDNHLFLRYDWDGSPDEGHVPDYVWVVVEHPSLKTLGVIIPELWSDGAELTIFEEGVALFVDDDESPALYRIEVP